MKKGLGIFTLIAFLFAGAWVISSCKSKSGHENHAAASNEKKLYHCPMHPTYTSDKPGDCPICSMKLVPVTEEEHEEAVKDPSDGSQQPGQRKILYYRSPMQPGVTSPVPKKDEMGMDYAPVYEGEETGTQSDVKGYATVKISSERGQLIGVKTGEVGYKSLKKVVRASARVAYDTELYNAIAEYKAALEAKEKVKESPWPDVHERSEALINAARLRLRQLGVSAEQLENVHNDYHDPTNLLLGEKGGSIWVYAQVYEYEAGLVRAGQIMEVSAPALPGKRFQGKIKAVDQILNSETRSLRVRAEVPNPEGLLKPEMYVKASIYVELGEKLAIPEEAVLDTGERQIVFVVNDKGKYEPRNVRLGQEADGYYEVLSGVSKGEKVVTSANFLVDSESKLKAAVSGAGSGHSH